MLGLTEVPLPPGIRMPAAGQGASVDGRGAVVATAAPARPEQMRRGTVTAVMLLVAVTAVWGFIYLVVQDATRRMPVMDFMAARFTVGALVLAVLRPRAVVSLDPAGWVRGVALGLTLGTSYTLQVYGLRHTSATVSAFVTGMFVVFTPLLSALVLRRRITPTALGRDRTRSGRAGVADPARAQRRTG
ncbi:DMT family transporter [Streptomyces adustus]|uniref:DMT family transporter n=1 Tax=Streptomyces adustus TaxID=1609272 RepID=A0A5N8VD65_9ACTN|nr:DMT family transporter [Streptomyces adustus]